MTTHAITLEEIREGMGRLGILGKPVVFHTSFGSYGGVEGGVDGYLSMLRESFPTMLLPVFTWESTIHAPAHDRPRQNGWDYTQRWQSPEKPFDVMTAGVDPRMGIVPASALKLPGTFRSGHPWHSWLAIGDRADELVHPHPWDIPNLPLEKLADLGGHVVLVGVSLKYCTAMHLAEERAGRRPFIRWALSRKGRVQRIRVAGCANWFENFERDLADLFQVERIGGAVVKSAPLRELIQRVTKRIQEDPQKACCSPDCLKCQDALKGGPIEEEAP